MAETITDILSKIDQHIKKETEVNAANRTIDRGKVTMDNIDTHVWVTNCESKSIMSYYIDSDYRVDA